MARHRLWLRLRIQQFGRVGDELRRAAPACDLQDILVIRPHDVIVADPDDRIVSSSGIPKFARAGQTPECHGSFCR